MSKPTTPEIEPTTAWHPLLVALLECYLPDGWQLLTELQLTRLPQRVDIVVVRRVGRARKPATKIRSILAHLRPHTLIEHKGPTDRLEASDALVLLGYAAQYMRMNALRDPSELCLMVVADHVPHGFVEQVERMRGTFAATGGGLWRGEMAGLTLHGVETREAYRASRSDRLLYAFSRAFTRAPAGGLPLDAGEERVYRSMYEQVEQFRRLRGDMAVKDMEEIRRLSDEAMRSFLTRMSPAELDALIDALPKRSRDHLKQRLLAEDARPSRPSRPARPSKKRAR